MTIAQADGDDGLSEHERCIRCSVPICSSPVPQMCVQCRQEMACADCGEPVPIGGWPFCRSDRNPEGHARGVYAWKTRFSMKLQGWTRRER